MVTESRQAGGARIPGRCWENGGCPLRKNPSLIPYGAVIPRRIKELDVGSKENTVHQRQAFICPVTQGNLPKHKKHRSSHKPEKEMKTQTSSEPERET